MTPETLPIGPATLPALLVPRIETLRHYVQRKIPRRFRRTISTDDLLQEVWIAAYRTWPDFRPEGPNAIDRWLTTIVSSKLVDALRAARRLKRGGDRHQVDDGRRLASCSHLFAHLRSPERTPSRDVHAAEAGHTILILLNVLSEPRRQAIKLHYIDGCPLADVAAQMGRSEAAVNSLLFHGLRQLRGLLGDAAKYFSDVPSSEIVATGEGAPC